MLSLHDAKHGRNTEQFIHHLKVSSYTDRDCQVDRALALLSLYTEPYKANPI